jgi:hypothetical protein
VAEALRLTAGLVVGFCRRVHNDVTTSDAASAEIRATASGIVQKMNEIGHRLQ